jgi:hypothetical protein
MLRPFTVPSTLHLHGETIMAKHTFFEGVSFRVPRTIAAAVAAAYEYHYGKPVKPGLVPLLYTAGALMLVEANCDIQLKYIGRAMAEVSLGIHGERGGTAQQKIAANAMMKVLGKIPTPDEVTAWLNVTDDGTALKELLEIHKREIQSP